MAYLTVVQTIQLAYGWGDPSNIIKHPKEDYYYAAIWNRNQVGLQVSVDVSDDQMTASMHYTAGLALWCLWCSVRYSRW
jgi:hypothetical protein